jgi:hypothetical protein
MRHPGFERVPTKAFERHEADLERQPKREQTRLAYNERGRLTRALLPALQPGDAT